MTKLLMIRKSVVAVILTGALIMASSVDGDTSSVASLRVEKDAGSSSFIIDKVGPVDVEDFMMEDPYRLVLDLIGAQHELPKNQFEGDNRWVERVRTSQFTNEPDQITRLVFDLRENVSYKVMTTDRSVSVRFFSKNPRGEKTSPPPTMQGSMASIGIEDNASQSSTKAPTPRPESVVDATDDSPQNQTVSETPKEAAQPAQQPNKSADEVSRPAKQAMPEAMNWNRPAAPKKDAAPKTNAAPSTTATRTQGFQSYAANTGLVRNKNITIDVQNADIKTVLRSMSEFSSTNIISGPEVEGKVTAHLKNVPWRQALDVVLKSHGFGWREEYGVIRVSTLDKLTKEELEMQAAERQKDSLLPLVTQIIPLSFSNAGELKKALKEVMTERGSMEVEAGNNALIVTDIQKTVDKIAVMVTELDQRIKQVEIVAKMVDVDFESSREMGVRWDALNLTSPDANAVADAIIDAQGSQPVGAFRVGTVQSWGEVQLLIDMMERENKADIISNPRIVTADNREANILVGKEIPLIVSDEAGNPITELTKVGIILRVTPHVNSDNTITLDLHPEVSELSSQATVQGGVIISLSEADTRVVVGHGETAVIGGLINEVESSLESGVPVLKDIPLLGGLFKLDNKTTKKRELIIFVTPRIVDSGNQS